MSQVWIALDDMTEGETPYTICMQGSLGNVLVCTCPVIREHALNASCVGAESGTLLVRPTSRVHVSSEDHQPPAMPPELIEVPAGTAVSLNPV